MDQNRSGERWSLTFSIEAGWTWSGGIPTTKEKSDLKQLNSSNRDNQIKFEEESIKILLVVEKLDTQLFCFMRFLMLNQMSSSLKIGNVYIFFSNKIEEKCREDETILEDIKWKFELILEFKFFNKKMETVVPVNSTNNWE